MSGKIIRRFEIEIREKGERGVEVEFTMECHCGHPECMKRKTFIVPGGPGEVLMNQALLDHARIYEEREQRKLGPGPQGLLN